MITIVDAKFADRSAVITVEGRTPQDVQSLQAKELVMQKAAERLSSPGFEALPPAYPVDSDGKYDEDLLLGIRQGVAAFRADYKVNGNY